MQTKVNNYCIQKMPLPTGDGKRKVCDKKVFWYVLRMKNIILEQHTDRVRLTVETFSTSASALVAEVF